VASSVPVDLLTEGGEQHEGSLRGVDSSSLDLPVACQVEESVLVEQDLSRCVTSRYDGAYELPPLLQTVTSWLLMQPQQDWLCSSVSY